MGAAGAGGFFFLEDFLLDAAEECFDELVLLVGGDAVDLLEDAAGGVFAVDLDEPARGLGHEAQREALEGRGEGAQADDPFPAVRRGGEEPADYVRHYLAARDEQARDGDEAAPEGRGRQFRDVPVEADTHVTLVHDYPLLCSALLLRPRETQ